MANPKRPGLGEIGDAFVAGLIGWQKRETTRAAIRWLGMLLAAAALAVIGPLFIASPIFPDPPTSIVSQDLPCQYDAVPEFSPRQGPQSVEIIAGRPGFIQYNILNRGSCGWDSRVAMKLETGSLPGAPEVISATETAPRVFFNTAIAYDALPANTVYNLTYRMVAPQDEAFGAPLRLTVVTHVEGQPPNPPRNWMALIGDLLTIALTSAPGALGFGLAVWRSGRFVKDFYSLKQERNGFEFVMRRVFNLWPPVSATLKGGDVELNDGNEEIDRIGGPGSLSIHGDTAAVIECGGRYSRIVGPGSHQLAAFERVRAAFDLRRLNRRKAETAYTKDGIEVKAETTVSFKLMEHRDGEAVVEETKKPSWRTLLKTWLTPAWWTELKTILKQALGIKSRPSLPSTPIRFSHEAIRTFVYELPASARWDSTVSTGLGELIPKKMLDELWAPEDPDRNPRKEIVDELFQAAKEKERKKGIELIDLAIGPFKVTQEVDLQRRDYWAKYWEARSNVTTAEGDATALRYAQTARAEAQAELIQAIAQSFRMLAVSGATPPSRNVALKLIEVIARTMKATLEEAEEGDEPADKALRILEQLRGIVKLQ